MVCKICGAPIDAESVYCQKCGQKLDEISISPKVLSDFLKEKMESSDAAEIQSHCQHLIDKVNGSKFKKVELHKSSLSGIDLSDIISEKGDTLRVECKEPEEFLKLAAALFINEADTRHNEMVDIIETIHNDRKADLLTANMLYVRAGLTKDVSRREKKLDNASDSCIAGINKLRLEINNHLDFFERLPKSTLKKLFCGISIQSAEANLVQMQEAFRWYCEGVRLLIKIDIQNKEQEKIRETIETESTFIKTMIGSRGYKRLLEVDDENVEKWDEYVNGLEVSMYCVANYIDADTITIRVLEEKI